MVWLSIYSFPPQGLLAGEYDHLPEMAFYMIGDIAEAVTKADEIAMETSN